MDIPPHGGTPVRLLALNIQHAAVRRVPLVAKAVLDAVPDVVVLSEFYLNIQGGRLLGLLEAAGLVHQAHGVAGSERYPYTVVIASRTPIAHTRRPLDGSPHAQRILEATISGISVAAVYFPLAKEHDPFWDGLFSPYADSLATRPAIIAGDWNTGSGALDIGGGPVAGMSRFDCLLASGWTDAWRALHPDVREFTWYNRRSGNGFRIDHALLSPVLVPRLLTAENLHGTRTSGTTDHSGLLVDLDEIVPASEAASSRMPGSVRPG
jgi:exodeoxyribonuclease-3